MEDRDPELPVATVRPRHAIGRVRALRGALWRWAVAKRRAITGRHVPFILTGVVFSGMMLAMGYVADRANHAADAIDEMHREQQAWPNRQRGTRLFSQAPSLTDPWAHSNLGVELHEPDEVEPEDMSSGAGAAATAVGRNAPLFYIVAGDR